MRTQLEFGLPEYYTVKTPPLVSSSIETPFNAYGWLIGGNNIVGEISSISGTNNTYAPPEPWLFGELQSDIVSGECISTFETPFSNVSGTVKGIVIGNTNDKTVSGNLVGNIYSANNSIPISGIISGTISDIKSVLSGTFFPGKVAKIDKVSGYIFDPNESLANITHVLDIKDYNTLGRKGLSNTNPLLGYNLQETSKNLDINDQYAIELWKIIEYSNEYVPEQIVENNTIQTNVQTQHSPKLLSRASINTTLATPAFLTSLHDATYEEVYDNHYPGVSNVYYCYLNDNIITIKQYLENEIINEENSALIFGPAYILEDCTMFIIRYAEINNYNLIKNNDYEYMVTNNVNKI